MKYIFLLLLLICSLSAALSQETKEPDNLLTAGYFEKLKESYFSKEFVFLGNDKYNEHNLRDLVTGAIRYDIPEGTRLKCIDLLPPDSTNKHLVAIFQHPGYGRLTVCCHQGIFTRLIPLQEYRERAAKREQQEKKYGHKDAKLIREGFVAIGFTKQMCRESWGEPDKVNITKRNNGPKDEWNTKHKFGTDEEWIYSGTFSNGYLYFENGVLTRFQN